MRADIGVLWPESFLPGTALPAIPGLARLAEQAGLDCLWIGDRLTSGESDTLDASLMLAAAAAVTSRIPVGFAIYVPSLRPLAWAAKQIGTLAHIAGDNRLRLGVGLGGGVPQDYRAAGFRHEDRARRTDEFLRLLPGLLGGQPTAIPDSQANAIPDGQPTAIPDGRAELLKLRPIAPVPPVWVGGTSPAALRRAVRFADGWLSGLQTPEEFAASSRRLDELSDQAGRPPLPKGIGLHAAIGQGPQASLADVTAGVMQTMFGVPADRARQLAIAGTPAQVASQLAPYIDAGAQLFAVVCDPVPSERSWELLADVRLLLNQDSAT